MMSLSLRNGWVWSAFEWLTSVLFLKYVVKITKSFGVDHKGTWFTDVICFLPTPQLGYYVSKPTKSPETRAMIPISLTLSRMHTNSPLLTQIHALNNRRISRRCWNARGLTGGAVYGCIYHLHNRASRFPRSASCRENWKYLPLHV